MATVLRPNSLFSGVIATERLTRSKKLMMTPTPSNRAMRHRRLVQRDGDSSVKGVRWFAGSKTHHRALRRPAQTLSLASLPSSPSLDSTLETQAPLLDRDALEFTPHSYPHDTCKSVVVFDFLVRAKLRGTQ